MKNREHILAHIIGYVIFIALIMVFLSNLPAYSVAPEVTVKAPPLPSAPEKKPETRKIISKAKRYMKPLVSPQEKPVMNDTDDTMTMDEVIEGLAPELRPELKRTFNLAGIEYPPSQLTMIALKEERRLELWSPDNSGTERMVMRFPIYGASGDLGPKLRQGDLQVPEGIYRVLWFNPNSQFYLSMKIDYPNAFDRRMAQRDGRTNLGGDIFIHGYDVSLGCLAIGNPAIEKLFLLVHDTGKHNTRVIIAPYDLRRKTTAAFGSPVLPEWTDDLYMEIKEEMSSYQNSENWFLTNMLKLDFLPIPRYLVAHFNLPHSQ